MTGNIKCFFIEPIPKVTRYLRRFVFSSEDKCTGNKGYHDFTVLGDVEDLPVDADTGSIIPDDELKKNPLWPAKCACGYEFRDEDQWQWGVDRMWKAVESGETFVLDDAPVGAMWYADWMPHTKKAADGHCLVVKLPNGNWNVDGPSRNNGVQGSGWTRTGTVPLVTVRPSILMDDSKGRFHAFLTNGELVRCGDSTI